MATINSRSVQDSLDKIKRNVNDGRTYFAANYKHFNDMRKFVLQSSLSSDDVSLMQALKRPQLEFNILEAYVSRFRGEFSKQEPSIEVRNGPLSQTVDPVIIQIIEAHIRSIILDSNRDNVLFDIFTDVITGGFSVMKVFTEYLSNRSMDQGIFFERAYDPTLCVFDKMARKSHKGDGKYCAQIFPMTEEDFKSKYGSDSLNGMNFYRDFGGYSWTYSTQDGQKIILVVHYYAKKIKKSKLVQLVDDRCMLEDEYEEFLAKWNDSGMVMMPPGVVGKPRQVEIETITRTEACSTKILDYVETDYRFLPLIFFDGNSAFIRDSDDGSAYQLTKSLVYHARGIQQLKNYAGISLANELENTVQHKILAAQEAIPEQYTSAYLDVQLPSTLIYKAFDENNNPLPPPSLINRTPIPPEISGTFMMADQVTQSILGSYDAALGINNNELSGKAIQNGAIQSNAASMPFIVNFMKGLNRLAEIILDLIPKYYDTPRTIPIKDISGKRDYILINAEGAPRLEYDSDALQVTVEAGVNFEIQRNQALDTLIKLMGVSPFIQQFIATEEAGIEMLLDNIDVRGIDALKQGIAEFIQRTKQQQAQQAQMQQQATMIEMQNNPTQVMREEIQQRAQKNQVDAQLKAAQLGIDKQEADTNRMLTMAKIGEMMGKEELEKDKVQAENARTALKAVTSNIGI